MFKISTALLLCVFPLAAIAQQRPQVACTPQQAIAAEDQRDWTGAIRVYTCLAQANPRDWRPLNSIAGVYGILQRPADEIQWANRAIALAPDQPEPYVNRGNAEAVSKNTAGAQASFEKAMQVAPQSPLGAYSLGVLADQARDAKTAEGWYRKALGIDPTFEDAEFSLAALLGNTGRVAQAIPILQKLIAADPQAEDAKQMLQAMQHPPQQQTAPQRQPAPIERR